MVADRMFEHRELGYHVVGFVDDRAGGDHLGYRGLPLLGTLAEAPEIAAREQHRPPLRGPADGGARQDARPGRGRQPRVRRREGGARPAPVHRPARPARGPRRHSRSSTSTTCRCRASTRWSSALLDIVISLVALAVMVVPGLLIAWLIKRSSNGPVFYQQTRMGLDGRAFTGLQVPHHAARRRGRYRPGVGQRRRPAGDPGRPLAAALRPRRVAAVPQRAEGRDVDRRAAARTPLFRRAVQAPHPAVHAPPQGQGRHHRLGPGQRLARQHLAREAHRVRPVLHRELVGVPGPQDHLADRLRGIFSHRPAY